MNRHMLPECRTACKKLQTVSPRVCQCPGRIVTTANILIASHCTVFERSGVTGCDQFKVHSLLYLFSYHLSKSSSINVRFVTQVVEANGAKPLASTWDGLCSYPHI